MKRLIRAVPFAAAGVLLAGSAPAQETCPGFRDMAEAAVPTAAGDREVMARLLGVKVGAQLSQSFDPATAEKAVGDHLHPDAGCRRAGAAPCFYRNRISGSVLHLKLPAGRATYLNPSRRFLGARGVDNPVTEAEAQRLALAGFAGFGVPAAEMGPPFVRALMAATQDAALKTKTQILKAEVHVNVQRHVEGTPVFASRLMAAVSAKDQIARLYVEWPDFSLLPGLSPAGTRPRPAVVESVVEKMGADNPCGSVAHVMAHIAYVPARLADPQEEDNGGAEGENAGAFVPALVVFAVPPEARDGEVQLGEEQFVVPLLTPPPR
ncbi:MAG: hypothetical protein DMF82_05615 [Acidobacteria bacterium]|nr:MAG: hypothetical protein DMF82_05615 [Acidobacteriota bacterium]